MFWSYFFFLQLFLDLPYPPLYPASYSLSSLSQKQSRNPKNENQNIPNQKQNTQKAKKFVLCWPTAGHETCPKTWLLHPVTLHCWHLCWHKLSFAHSILVRGGTLCPLLLSAGILSYLNPSRSCVYNCRSLCAFICVSALLCVSWSQPAYFALTIFLHSSLSLEGEALDCDIPFRSECSKIAHFLHIIHLWVSLLIIM